MEATAPSAAAVMIWRRGFVRTSPTANTPGSAVRVRSEVSEHTVDLIVEDEGSGIPKNIMDRLFEPFFTTKDKGYGLGLAMIKKMIEETGGLVDISSKEGEGTTVTLLFQPVIAGEEAAAVSTTENHIS